MARLQTELRANPATQPGGLSRLVEQRASRADDRREARLHESRGRWGRGYGAGGDA